MTPARDDGQVDRRRFLGTSVAAAGSALAMGGTGESRAAEASSAPREMTANGIPLRAFGKTGVKLPILGMGGSAMVDRWIASYGLTPRSIEDRAAMVRYAFDQGVRFFDTARVYGESEQIMGLGLSGVRDQCFVATKVAVGDPSEVRESLETSLAELKTDHVELVQIHSPAIERIGFEASMKIHAELLKLRDEKMFRYIGLTTHVAFDTVYRMIATGGFDQVLLAYGYFNKGMDTLLSNQNLERRNLCLAKADELGMAVVAMKVMGASIFGHNARNLVADYDAAARDRLPAAAIRWVLQDERVSMLNIGVSLPSDIDRNKATMSGDLAYTDDDRQLLADFSLRCYDAQPIKAMATV